MNKNNKGFSVVELIVVVLILGILGGGAAMGVSFVYNANVEQAAKTLCAMMSEARTQAMGQNSDGQEIALNIEQKTNGNYVAYITVDGTKGEEKQLSNRKVSLYVGGKNSTTADRKLLVNGTPGANEVNSVVYTFSKSTGGIKKSGSSGILAGDGTMEDQSWYDVILSGSSDIKVIVVPATGRCYITE